MESKTDMTTEITVVSNFNLYYEVDELSLSFSECAHRRMKISRMNREKQSNLMDIIEEYRDESEGKTACRYVGSIGFIKVNRVNKDAALVFLCHRTLIESIRLCLFQVMEMAQMPFYGLNRLYCCMSENTTSKLMIPALQSANFCHCESKQNDGHTILTYVVTFGGFPNINFNTNQVYNQKIVSGPSQDIPNQLNHCSSPLQIPHRNFPDPAWHVYTPLSTDRKYYCPVVSPEYSSIPASPATPTSIYSLSTIHSSQPHKDSDLSRSLSFQTADQAGISRQSSHKSQLEGSLNVAAHRFQPFELHSKPTVVDTPCSSRCGSPPLSTDTVSNKEKYDKSCVFWLKGVCAYGSSCHYKHSISPNEQPSPLVSDSKLKINTSDKSLNAPNEVDRPIVLLDLVNNATSHWLGLLRYLPFFLQSTYVASPAPVDLSCSSPVKEVDTPSIRSIPSSRSLVDDLDDKSMEDFTATQFSKVMVDRLLKYRERCRHHSSLPAIASLQDLLLIIGMKSEGLPSLLQLNEEVLRDYSLSHSAWPNSHPQALRPPPFAPSLSQLTTPPWFAGNIMYYSPTRRSMPSNPQLYSPFPAGMPFNMPPMSPYYRHVSPVTLYSSPYSPYYSSNSVGNSGSRSMSYPMMTAPFMQPAAGYSSPPQESIGKVAGGGRRPLSSKPIRSGSEEERNPIQSSPDSVARSPADCMGSGQQAKLTRDIEGSIRGSCKSSATLHT